ncbi:M20/M25/M40 family metallo-hydrolase [Gemmatimonas sp.]|uniref:M20/M25/M40 family metallo-hydrolase n=2 Tax=Gemmatimonas sp. TaxID=1962908 RepID=UPI0035653177
MHRSLHVALVAAACCSASAPLTAQSTPPAATATADSALAESVARWITLAAPPSGEAHALDALRPMLPGWTRDNMGNLVKRVGSGSPRRMIACAMDVPAFVVSGITDQGYVRLHRTGVAAHPLWDQFHEAQQLRILTVRGEVIGVVAIANGHFARQHRGDTAVVGVDQLWVDVGASTKVQAEALGISLLDPVVAWRPVWSYAGYASGPAAGARASCAAVASAGSAATAASQPGETIYVLSSQRSFGWVGLAAVLARAGRVDALTLFDEGKATGSSAMLGVARLGQSKRAITRVVASTGLDSVRVVSPSVRFAGSLVESVAADDVRTVMQSAARAGGLTAVPTLLAPLLDTARATMLTRGPRHDAYGALEKTFFAIADLPGVPGHEWRVREAITALLPAWAKSRAVVDSAGNLIVAAGPDRDSVAFIAHMDEVSFEVETIARDGTVRLARRGGVVPSAWEGQPAALHFDRVGSDAAAPSLRGVFIPRDSARVKAPASSSAWFGVDSATLVAQGVRVGSAVTGYKRAARLGGTRLTGRGSDDRTGSTALLHAVQRIDPNTLTRKVLFVWSVREEGGLNGAGAFGANHGRSLQRIYSVDTFVSSDTPLEDPAFAYAPLGKGFVLRGLDDGAISPPAERARVLSAARAQGIPVQQGTTHGATDGSAIAPYGAPNVGLSWPGRYSHTPGEVLDLRDVDALVRIITAMAVAR